MLAGAAVGLGLAAPGLLGGSRTAGERLAAGTVLALAIVASVLLARALGRLIRHSGADRERAAQASDRIEAVLVSLASRPNAASPGESARELERSAVAAVRLAIEEGEWETADRRLTELERDHPGSGEIAGLANELAEERQVAADGLRARLDASRTVNDPDGVLSAREALGRVVAAANLRELDQDLVRWLMVLIQKRMRTGTVRSDVAVLAERAVSLFGTTTEGASLRAALPVLRRSGGLCPRCAQPYVGVDDACPDCLGVGASSAAIPSLDELVSAPTDLVSYAEEISLEQQAQGPGLEDHDAADGRDS